MRYLILTGVFVSMIVCACESSKYEELSNASETDRQAGEKLWNEYMQALGDRQVGKEPTRLAKFFSGPLLASSKKKDFEKRIRKCLGRKSAGAFENVEAVAVKESPSGPLLIVDSKAGQAAVPVMKSGDLMRFAELRASTGDWSDEASHGTSDMPAEPSLLYIQTTLDDKQAPVGDRLRATYKLAQSKYRNQIISNQRKATDPIVRLGLGLARIKIDGSDESFLKNFPTNAQGIQDIRDADKDIFDEMIEKLTNMGAMVEDPPANEVLYQVVGGAPDAMRKQMGKALYEMAELGPPRFANAVRNLVKDMDKDRALAIYLEEVARRKGKAPKMMKFLKKFSRIGEPQERSLCRKLLSKLKEAS